jgi:hypothetical protein
LDEHPELKGKWVNDLGFREEVVRSDDPASTVERLCEITLQDETKEWINERVAFRTPDGLLDPHRPIPF